MFTRRHLAGEIRSPQPPTTGFSFTWLKNQLTGGSRSHTVTTRHWEAAHICYSPWRRASFYIWFCLCIKKNKNFTGVGWWEYFFFSFQHTSFHRTHEKKSIIAPPQNFWTVFSNQVGKGVRREHKLWEMKSPSDKGMRHDRETERQEREGSTITHVTDWVSMGPLCALAGACHLSRWVRVWMVTERCNGGDTSVGWVPERFQLLVMTNSYQVMAERLARFPQHKEKGHVWSL